MVLASDTGRRVNVADKDRRREQETEFSNKIRAVSIATHLGITPVNVHYTFLLFRSAIHIAKNGERHNIRVIIFRSPSCNGVFLESLKLYIRCNRHTIKLKKRTATEYTVEIMGSDVEFTLA